MVVVSEDIVGEITWSSSFQYSVTNDLQIAVGSSLTIRPVTSVNFTNATLFVFGTLDAVGTEDNPIVFTSDASWRGIRVLNPFNESVIANAVIERANGPALDIDKGLLSVSDGTIRFSAQGIRVRSNGTSIFGNEIYSNDIGVLSNQGNSFNLVGNTIRNNVIGISLAGPQGDLTFTGNNIMDNSDANLAVTGEAGKTVEASNNWWGTADAALVGETIRYTMVGGSANSVVYEPVATEEILTAP